MLASSAVAHETYRRTSLDKQDFLVGDPPRVKDPRDMNRDEYESFMRWIAENTTVPGDFKEAQQSAAVGAKEFRDNLKAATKDA
jgi:hypothetical protein